MSNSETIGIEDRESPTIVDDEFKNAMENPEKDESMKVLKNDKVCKCVKLLERLILCIIVNISLSLLRDHLSRFVVAI